MASIEKRRGKYRVRYRDPSGRNRSRTFTRKADADRFAREVEVDMDRGDWIDPRKSAISLQAWAETFLDEHLRLRAPFEELWFIGVRVDGPAAQPREMAVGYRQIAYEDMDRRGVRSTRFMITPARGGWTCWWNDRGREDLQAAFHR